MQPKQGSLKGSFRNDKGTSGVQLSLIEFREDECYIIYCPALDVSGYGLTETEAGQSFTTSLAAFFQYCLENRTLTSELLRLGWKDKTLGDYMVPPDMSKLLSENENFSRIFNNHSFKKYDRKIEIPIA